MDANTVNWLGLTIPFCMNKKDPYVVESVGHQLKYGELVRLPFKSGWRYYINLYLDGDAPKKKEIARQQRRVDQEKRALNPDHYDADGRVIKGKHDWVISNNCRRHQRRIRELYRKKSASTECSHNHLHRMLP